MPSLDPTDWWFSRKLLIKWPVLDLDGCPHGAKSLCDGCRQWQAIYEPHGLKGQWTVHKNILTKNLKEGLGNEPSVGSLRFSRPNHLKGAVHAQGYAHAQKRVGKPKPLFETAGEEAEPRLSCDQCWLPHCTAHTEKMLRRTLRLTGCETLRFCY